MLQAITESGDCFSIMLGKEDILPKTLRSM